MLESVFFLNVEIFGGNDSLGERIRIFSCGNVELIFRTGSHLVFYGHRVYRFTREVWKARVWLAATNYNESEITS